MSTQFGVYETPSEDRAQFEAFSATPEGRSLYATFGVKNYEDYLRVKDQMETRLRHAGEDKFKFNGDPEAWRTEALKRSAAVEAELRSSSGHGGF